MFWGEPQKQDLQNPQNLNSYSYAADNPIIKSDPSGKCVEDLCAGEVTALTLAVRYGPMVIGADGSGAGTIILNHLQNQSTSIAELTISTAVGGFTGEYLAARRVLAGGAAFFGSLAQDYAAKRPLDYGNAGTSAATAFLTGEFFKFGVGASSLEKAAAKGVTNLSDAAMVNELRYQLSLGAFQMSAAGVVQNAYVNSQKAMSSSLQYAKSTPSTLPSTVKQNGINYVRNSSGLLNVSTH